jgi:hypothetical protein
VKYIDPDGRISEETIKAFLKSTNNDYGVEGTTLPVLCPAKPRYLPLETGYYKELR